MKKVILGIVVLVILGLGGAVYWYFEVYQPKQFAKEVVIIYLDFHVNIRGAFNQPDEASAKKESLMVVKNTQAKLNELKPPRQMTLVHQNFIAYLDGAEHFMTIFRSGPFDQAISDAEKNQMKLGNDLDSNMQELIRIYPELKSLTEK